MRKTELPGFREKSPWVAGIVWGKSGPAVVLELPSGRRVAVHVSRDQALKFEDALRVC